ncbi:hypothetical protein PCASD_12773 [Puccinia coronata f. sp. avenae]|uniref:Protein kinase domain-containing protein n=1 Tax=Puccinia coronata f. sp. avenae TaxID=200324 RepID=A0A2N5SZ92_9BASI|nr:hypothetical protein PCASD_12773 [Puccinia coronata f. sp. avenae]
MADRSLKLVAIKVVGLKQPNQHTCQTFHLEIALLNRLRGHNRVINFIEFSMDNVRRKVRLVMEHRETYLNQFLNRQMGKPISSWFIKHIGEQMLEAVHAVHEMGIIHTDLKPANFVLVQPRDSDRYGQLNVRPPQGPSAPHQKPGGQEPDDQLLPGLGNQREHGVVHIRQEGQLPARKPGSQHGLSQGALGLLIHLVHARLFNHHYDYLTFMLTKVTKLEVLHPPFFTI